MIIIALFFVYMNNKNIKAKTKDKIIMEEYMEIIKIIGLSIGSILILFILTKIMGQREMSQLSVFDYFITITIGSIAAEIST